MAKKGTFIDKVGVISKKASRLTQRKPKLKFHFGWHYKHSAVKPNRILFESFHGKNISDSPLAVLQALLASGKADSYEIYYSTDDVKRDQKFVDANHLPVTLVDISTRRYPYVLATAKYLINNSSFPAYFIRKPEQVYVQTWHGTPWKALGKRMRLGMESMYNVQHNFLQASVLTFPNDFTREAIMRDYNLEDLFSGTVAMVGYPRNSVFLRERNEDLRKRLDLQGYETFAYMPTWRGKSNHDVAIASYRATIEDYFSQLDEALRDDQKLFVNFHSMVASSISLGEYRHIFPFPANVGNYEFLAQMDALITDYSSVFFDFALTGRPIVLFAYDMEEYLRDRGLYFPIDELPFPLVETIDDLCSCLVDGSYARPVQGREEFAQKYLAYDTAENDQNVLKLLLEQDVSVPQIDYSDRLKKSWRMFCPEQKETLADVKSMFEYANSETDVLVLPRSKCGPAESACIHDSYRDEMNYLFRTMTTPRTYIEDVTKRFVPTARKRLNKREHQRLLGAVPVESEYYDYSVIQPGFSHSDGAMVDLPAHVSTDGSKLVIDFENVPGVLQNVFITRFRQVMWVRPCTDEEIASTCVILDLKALVEDLLLVIKRNNRYVVSVSFEPEDNGHVRVGNPVDYARADAKGSVVGAFYPSIELSADEIDTSGADDAFQLDQSFVGLAKGRALMFTPHYSEYGKFSVLVAYEGDAADFLDAKLTRIATPGQKRVVVKARMRKGDFKVSDVVIQNRIEASPIMYSLPYEEQQTGGWIKLVIRFNPKDYYFNSAYWDLKIVIEDSAGKSRSCYIQTTSAFRSISKFRNWQADAGDGNILFPYGARRFRLAFAFRERTKTDTAITRVKEVTAFALFAVLHSYWTRKRVWLVFEKYCSLAQDNGFYFFKYCMDELPEKDRKHIFYVIDRASADYANVEPYKSNVIDFMSFKHMLYLMVADIYIGSDSKSHLYQWRPKPNVVRGRIMRHKILFLQHGVTALKRVDKLFGKEGTNPMTYFLTTSEREQQIVMDNFGYDLDQAPVLGFSRWDVLEDKRNAAEPTILLMPTWRTWLEDLTDEMFVKSEYYHVYSAFVQSEGLQSVLAACNAKVKFFIHPKLSAQLQNFSSDYDNVELIEMGSQPLNELIMECSLLITDYSSVCWDVLYMDKPVVYYQFDQQAYKDDIGSYIDFDSELPGKVCKTEQECIDAIRDYAESGFEMTPTDMERSNTFLPAKDKNNRARTYNFLVSKGF